MSVTDESNVDETRVCVLNYHPGTFDDYTKVIISDKLRRFWGGGGCFDGRTRGEIGKVKINNIMKLRMKIRNESETTIRPESKLKQPVETTNWSTQRENKKYPTKHWKKLYYSIKFRTE